MSVPATIVAGGAVAPPRRTTYRTGRRRAKDRLQGVHEIETEPSGFAVPAGAVIAGAAVS